MSVMIQIRNVPEPLHRKLKLRAAGAGMSLSEYLLRAVERITEVPTREEMLARLEQLETVELSESYADAVRAEREGR